MAADDAKTVGVLGLGLIGGSLAKAYRDAGWRVLAFDLDEDTMGAARVETIDGILDEATVGECDLDPSGGLPRRLHLVAAAKRAPRP